MPIPYDFLVKVQNDVGFWRLTHGEKILVQDTINAVWERLGGNEPHRAIVTEHDWVISHTLECRLREGGLLACEVNARGLEEPGRYELHNNGQWSKIVVPPSLSK